MASNLARRGTQKDLTPEEAKAQVLLHIQRGLKVDDACALVSRSPETYRKWRREDEKFREAVGTIRKGRDKIAAEGRPDLPSFEEFCETYLRQPLHPHQLRILDVIEGRAPRDMHDSMSYEPGYLDRVICNVPPEHGKTTTFTVNWTIYNLIKNPDIRVVLISQGIALAKDFLYEIKQKLTSPLYLEMQQAFAPENGWKDETAQWSSDRIYIRGKNATAGEDVQKDPTIQVMGLKGTIYGRRADLVIMDDTITTKNANEIDFQERLLNREIESRLPSEQEGGGLLLILGTRVSPKDLYKHLRDVRDADDNQVWTYFRQPAVLDYGNGDSLTWKTLWPEKWNGSSLARRRRDSAWNLVYQQLDVDDDMTFRAECVNASIQQGRFPGPMTPEGHNHRSDGMRGLYVVAGLDPATTGNTAMIVVGLDRSTGKRWVLDGFNQAGTTPQQRNAAMKRFTEMYGVHEWVIETNAFQRSITLDIDLMNWFRAHGARVGSHYTTNNKYDANWGVPTMSPLFDSCAQPDPKRPGIWKSTPREQHLIELPATRQNEWVNDLVQQLTVWQPAGMAQHTKTDLVMALWFTHIACQKLMTRNRARKTHADSAFLTPSARKRQGVIDLAAMRREKQQLREGIA